MCERDISPTQVAQIRDALPKKRLEEGFAITVFVVLNGRWKACIDFIDGSVRILEGNCK